MREQALKRFTSRILVGKTRGERFWIGICALLTVLLVLSRTELPQVFAGEKGNDDLFRELKLFTDVLAIVQRDYVQEVGAHKLVEGAVKGMLTNLDPHSGYLDPDFYQDLQVQTKGEFGGLGVEISIKDGLLVVVAAMEGSPAAKAGLKSGDSIVKIDGKFTKEYTLIDAIKRLRGPKGSPITLSIVRKGRTGLLDVVVVRDVIQIKSVRTRYLGDGFGYARINQFMEKTADSLKDGLRAMVVEAKRDELRGLVLDLRNNPGGLLTQAIRVSDLFLSSGIIVYTDGRVESQKQKFFARARGTEPDYPIVVLVNGGSASASEIVAGALKDHGRALILGTQTFGKGSVQTITPLESGGALTLTTALYYTKSGRSLQQTGVKPDIEMDVADVQGGERDTSSVNRKNDRLREGDLPGAIKNPNGREGDGSDNKMRELNQVPTQNEEATELNPETADVKILLERDPQLARALDLLKTFDIFKAPISTEVEATPVPQSAAQ